MMTYITTNGDTWDSISYKCYGSEFLYQQIMDINRQFSDVVIFEGGEEIQVPDNIFMENVIIPSAWSKEKQINVINPPW